MKRLEHYITNLKEPQKYLDGISADLVYNPEKINFFSRLRCSEFVNDQPIIHYRFNLLFNLKGSIQIHIDKHIITLNEGESLLVFPYQNHHYVSSEDKDLLWLFIGFEMRERKGLEPLLYNPVKIEPYVLESLERMITGSNDLKSSILSTIIHLNLENSNKGGTIQHINRDEDTIITKVQKLVYFDLSRILTTSIIAQEIGISESSLHKHFKKFIGISPGRYLREVKINYACSILESGKRNITETASLCGFDSVYSFSRSFKQVTGFPPSRFKNTENGK
ncbi:MAG: AraC family transcriptional regulator [Spirochaetaceae bacterium]